MVCNLPRILKRGTYYAKIAVPHLNAL